MSQWLPLTEYSAKYKVSVSTLRRRIKSEDIKYQFQDGKYFIYDDAMINQMTQNSLKKQSPSLGITSEIELSFASGVNTVDNNSGNSGSGGYMQALEKAENKDFLENLKKSANTRLPSIKDEVGVLTKNKPQSPSSINTINAINIEEEYYLKQQIPNRPRKITEEFTEIPQTESKSIKDFSEKISKIGNNEPILTAANKLLTELKRAYTQILHEKEEQITTLKEEVSDLKTLVKVLESENSRLKE